MNDVALQLLLLLALGLLQLFFGYPLFRLLVVLAGAALGYAYGPLLLTGLTARPVEPWMALVAALIAALILGLLAWLAFWTVVFLWGAALGFSVADPLTVSPWLPLLAALLLGILAVVFQRLLIVVLTSLSGAWLTVTSGAALVGIGGVPRLGYGAGDPWSSAVILALAAVGALVQFRRSAATSSL